MAFTASPVPHGLLLTHVMPLWPQEEAGVAVAVVAAGAGAAPAPLAASSTALHASQEGAATSVTLEDVGEEILAGDSAGGGRAQEDEKAKQDGTDKPHPVPPDPARQQGSKAVGRGVGSSGGGALGAPHSSSLGSEEISLAVQLGGADGSGSLVAATVVAGLDDLVLSQRGNSGSNGGTTGIPSPQLGRGFVKSAAPSTNVTRAATGQLLTAGNQAEAAEQQRSGEAITDIEKTAEAAEMAAAPGVHPVVGGRRSSSPRRLGSPSSPASRLRSSATAGTSAFASVAAAVAVADAAGSAPPGVGGGEVAGDASSSGDGQVEGGGGEGGGTQSGAAAPARGRVPQIIRGTGSGNHEPGYRSRAHSVNSPGLKAAKSLGAASMGAGSDVGGAVGGGAGGVGGGGSGTGGSVGDRGSGGSVLMSPRAVAGLLATSVEGDAGGQVVVLEPVEVVASRLAREVEAAGPPAGLLPARPPAAGFTDMHALVSVLCVAAYQV